MAAGQAAETRGGYRRNSGRPAGVREARPRKPKALTRPVVQLPPLPAGVEGVTRSLTDELATYAERVSKALLAMIESPETPADVRLAAVREYHDRVIGPVPKVTLQHVSGNGAGPAPSPRRFEFTRSLQPVADVPALLG
jgi:hypothetical protein